MARVSPRRNPESSARGVDGSTRLPSNTTARAWFAVRYHGLSGRAIASTSVMRNVATTCRHFKRVE